ncbi:superoxide dismutase [Alkalihalobacillus macyae]|uniref:superoxide dismutase n=1 Tax=Guptibacillus hwajinpoensis TaxID=208199 RepID=UPI00273AEF92|nr:superoxide dismutase [Alkalihalobacillus macyae]MDP4550685.1 superoxide dismutase [Alkalihalobacillus macyae]
MVTNSTQALISWGYTFRNYVQSSPVENHIKYPILSNTEKWLHELENAQGVRYEGAYTQAEKLYDDFQAASRVQQSVPIGGHTLPPLPYAYNALEPSISERIMTLHHDIHHQSYVDGLNKAEVALQEARQKENFELIKHWERELAFNGAGHYLHTLFWEIMSPDGGKPKGPVVNEITKSFGSFNQFKKQFTNAANKVEGSGWAILVWSPVSRRLEILQAEKHQNLSQWDVIPLLALDVWEHAYYLQYENDRKQYIDNWWKIVNWPEVNKRFEKARTITWKPF